MGLDLVLLPDEPYVFTATDGPEAFATHPDRTHQRSAADLVRTVTGTGPLDSRGAHPDPVTVPHPAHPPSGHAVRSVGVAMRPRRSRWSTAPSTTSGSSPVATAID